MNTKLNLIYESLMLGISKSLKESLYDFNKKDSLQEIYESIGNQILNNYELNESLSDVFNNISKKAKGFINAGKNLVDKMSDNAKKAVENIKKQAGETWDKVKNSVTSVIAIIDNAIRNSGGFIKFVNKLFGIAEDEADKMIATGYYNILSSNLPMVPLVVDYIIHIPKTQEQLFIMNMLLIIIPIANKTFDIDFNALTDLIKTIKFSKSNGVAGEVSASMDHI